MDSHPAMQTPAVTFASAAAFLAVALAVLTPAPVHAQETPDFRAEFKGQFEASARKFVALSEAMPAESYSWSPMEGVMTVARVYRHVARYNYMYPHLNLGIDAPKGVDYRSLEEGGADKEEVARILAESMDHVRAVVDGMSDADLAAPVELYGRKVASWAVLLQLVTHMNEHLGQSIAYARMNRVVPPWSS
ncbi:MAG: DinB family protein [Gemmatimonadota bacterium]|nr:DinB family protein [Gemmatimonadota bacterium]